MKTRLSIALIAAILGSACSSDPEPWPTSRQSVAIPATGDTAVIPVNNDQAVDAQALAARYNREGREMWLRKVDLPAAIALFRQAVRLDPQPHYQFNLCYGLHQIGAYLQAKEPCMEVAKQTDNESLAQKAQLVLDDIEKRLRAAEELAQP